MEEEENNQLAFLDVLVCCKDSGGLKTNVFRKATNTMQVLNFNKNRPVSHKRSCVRTLYWRVQTHCSEPEDKIAELQYLRRVFKANGYPRNFVNRYIRKRDERPNRTDTKVWRVLPYVKTEGWRTQSGYLQGEGSSEIYAVSVEPACNTTNDDSYSAKTDTFVEPPDQGANTSEAVASSDLTETTHVNGTNQATEEPREHDVRDNGVMLTDVTNATGNSAGAKLRCLYTNAQSLISKLDELKLCLVELSPDVLAVTETWLSGNISDNEVAQPGYQIYRRDREHRQGGGIVVYVNDGLAVSDNTTKFACSTEAIWLTIKATGSPCLDVLTVYRPPRTDRIADTQLLEQLGRLQSDERRLIRSRLGLIVYGKCQR
nr:unnamed protein product [Spirometra erinaceieuropaei]